MNMNKRIGNDHKENRIFPIYFFETKESETSKKEFNSDKVDKIDSLVSDEIQPPLRSVQGVKFVKSRKARGSPNYRQHDDHEAKVNRPVGFASAYLKWFQTRRLKPKSDVINTRQDQEQCDAACGVIRLCIKNQI